MKQLLLTFFALLFIAFSAQAECRIDTAYRYNYVTGTSVKELIGRSIYTYNAANQETETLEQIWQSASGTWLNTYRYLLTYNSNNKRTEYAYYTWNAGTNTFEGINRTNFSYDGNNNLIETVNFNWNSISSTWVPTSKVTYTFDSGNRELQMLQQLWNATLNQWDNSAKTDNVYDANGNKISTTRQNWSASQWRNSFRFLFAYNADNRMIESVRQNWDNVSLAWENVIRDVKAYNSKKLVESETAYQWIGSVWTAAGRSTYTYNAADKVTESLYEVYNSGTMTFENSGKATSTYDGNNLNTLYLYQVWNGITNSWDNQSKTTYTYNNDGNLLSYLIQNWQSGAWVNSQGNIKTYSPNGDLFSTESFSVWNSTGNYYNFRDLEELRCTSINVGLEEADAAAMLKVYPNPINGNFFKVQSAAEMPFQLTDLSGKIITQGTLTIGENIMDANAITNGIYLFKAGNQVRRMIVQQ